MGTFKTGSEIVEAVPAGDLIDTLTGSWQSAPQWAKDAHAAGVFLAVMYANLTLKLPDGTLQRVARDQWIARGNDGVISAVQPSEFAKNYAPV